MNTYGNEFYDLVTRALGGNDNKRIQGFMDDALAIKYGALQIDGFSWAEMQLDFTYEQVMKDFSLGVMANYYDLDSPAVPFATEGVDVYTDKIPRMKAVEYFNEDKYRKMLITEQRFGAGSEQVSNAAFKSLFNTVDTLVGSHINSLTYQRHQMVSNGKVQLTNTNNAYGVQNITLSAHIPSANITTLTGTKRWWTAVSDGTYATPGSACDPIADLKAIVKKAKAHGVRGHFEVEETFLDQVLDHPKVVDALKERFSISLGYGVSGVTAFDRDAKVAALAAVAGAPIKSIDSIVAVESLNATTKKVVRTQMNAFADNVIVFVPDGNLGEILTVEPLKISGGTFGSYFDGRLLLTISADASKKCQSFETEMTSLVVPDKSKVMFYLHPYNAS